MPQIISNVRVGAGAKAVAAGTEGFYVGLFGAGELVRVSPGGGIGWQIATGGQTNGVAVWENLVVASNRDNSTISIHSTATGLWLATLPSGRLPWGISTTDGLAYVINFGDNSVSVVDLVGLRVVATTPVAPLPVAVIAEKRRAYIAHLDGQITILDHLGQIITQTHTNVSDVRGIAWDRLRGRLYLGSLAGYIVVLDADSFWELTRIKLPGPASTLALNPGTGRLFAVDPRNDRLYVVEPDGSGVGKIALPAQDAADGGQGLAIRENTVAVANYADGSLTLVKDGLCADRLTPGVPLTPLPSVTPTVTATATSPPTLTASPLPSPTHTATPPLTPTPTRTPTRTVTPTTTLTSSPTTTATFTRTVTATTSPTATSTPTRTATTTITASPTVTPTPTPAVIRAKLEILWPHNSVPIQEGLLANLTAYLLVGDGRSEGSAALDPPPCDWAPTVRLWGALNSQPARPVAVGQKRLFTVSGRTFPVWDFNDIDISAARDPANKLFFFVSVDGVQTLPNVWIHASDARTIFPQQDVPRAAVRQLPKALDARIEIVWLQDSLPIEQATRANITAYLFAAGTSLALAPSLDWSPTVRLHSAPNNDAEESESTVIGRPRIVEGVGGVRFLAWDFNDVDVSAARDPLNRMYFWVTVDDAMTYPNIWAHGADVRTVFPQPDILNSCR